VIGVVTPRRNISELNGKLIFVHLFCFVANFNFIIKQKAIPEFELPINSRIGLTPCLNVDISSTGILTIFLLMDQP